MKHVMTMLLLQVILLQAHAVTFYITPDAEAVNNTCTEHVTTLRPCYSLQELDSRLYSNENSVTLVLLPGIHVVPEHNNFTMSNISELAIHPLRETQFTDVECRVSYLIFYNIGRVIISSTNFTSCTLKFALGYTSYTRPSELRDEEQVLNITNCVFTDMGPQYTIIIAFEYYRVYIESCKFLSNYGAVFSDIESIFSVSNTLFLKNVRRNGNGSALYVSGAELSVNNCQFVGNVATSGGAIYCTDSSHEVMIESSGFINNSALASGSAIYSHESFLLSIRNCQFDRNSARISGGAIYFEVLTPTVTVEIYLDTNTFTANNAEMNGGVLYCKNYRNEIDQIFITVNSGSSLSNSAVNGGFMYSSRCKIRVSGSQISNNSATIGGAMYLEESELSFNGGSPISISHNTAEMYGGGLFLSGSANLITESSLVLFEKNAVTSAGGKGGAIFVLDGNCEFISYPKNRCFIDCFSTLCLRFLNNSADQGPVLYGGLLDRCLPYADFTLTPERTPLQIFKNISDFENSPLAITSVPIKVCLCIGGKPDCSVKVESVGKMRGESVKVALAALDQAGNPMESIITASYTQTLSAELKQGERSREISNSCSDLDYHIYATESTKQATLVLEPSENPCRESQLSIFTIQIRLLPCSNGFELKDNMCGCDRRLSRQFNITVCDIDNRSIQRGGPNWLRYDDVYLKIVSNCPLDYCQVTDENISLSSPDDQCANSRSGILCGECQGNYSITLGGSRCRDCTSSYSFIWLTVVFAVAGLALVALLLVCNITISAGTLNGLIFYANVVSTSGLTSLHNCSISPVLSVFIAWVNLDLGVETCFYSGMNTYQKTWLQFAFPLYIWLLVGAIIVASYYSSTAMKLFGRNNVAILATLFLLSYSKLLKTIVTALSVTKVWRGAADNVSDPLTPYKVWTYDGNVEYLKGQHVALFVVAFLFLVFLFLPYTLLLLFGQCVRSMSVRRCRWILRLIRSTAFISIMDAYHAPYKTRHRYWTGLMLLTRCFLFLVFATNAADNIFLTNTFTIALTTIVILLATIRLSVYRSTYIEYLEVCFQLNLLILSVTILYVAEDTSTCQTLTASISICFILFLGILVYHTSLQIRKKNLHKSALFKRLKLKYRSNNPLTEDLMVADSEKAEETIEHPTTSVIELN